MNDYYTEATSDKRLLLLGAGAVAKAALPLLLQYFDQAFIRIRLLAPEIEGNRLAEKYGIEFHQMKLTPENYENELRQYLRVGDVLLNLALNVDSLDLLTWTQTYGVRYLDTSLESWPGRSRTRSEARREVLRHARTGGPTAIIAHGANPGLVTHFVKQGLCELACIETPPSTYAGWAELSQRLGIQLIQITEYDFHESAQTPIADEFVNTWSAHGLASELNALAELGWGDHERQLPPKMHSAINHKTISWTPSFGEFQGYLIGHHEAFSINELLTPKCGIGRPTVYYTVRLCPAALKFLSSTSPNTDKSRSLSYRVMDNDLHQGGNELGALLMCKSGVSYWFGSKLILSQARELVADSNATSLQVAAGVLSGLIWALENPSRGIVEAEEMDFRRVLDLASPWLGRIYGISTCWRPSRAKDLTFEKFTPTTVQQ